MKPLFVDTSAWDAIADKGDKNHISALQFRNDIIDRYTLMTSNYVLDELYTLLLMNIGYEKTVDFKSKLDLLIDESVLKVKWVTRDISERAWNIFKQFNVDKSWSFTDCTSKVIMNDGEINEVFAYDHHFEQMGFLQRP